MRIYAAQYRKARKLHNLLFFLFSLVYVILFPFSYIARITVLGLPGQLHSLTVFGFSYTMLVFNHKMRGRKLLTRFFLIIIFFYLAYQVYDVFWAIDFSLFSVLPNYADPALLRFLTFVLLPGALLKWKLKNPKFSLKGFALLLLIDFLMILWLESTGFFLEYWRYYMNGFQGTDPHGWVWFIGKLVSFLAAPLTILNPSLSPRGDQH